jgi:flagellar hook-associated protein 1
MSINQALATAVAGLRVTQAGLSVVAANVANADTPGYVRKTASQVETAAGDSISVRFQAVNRVLDQYVQRQLRTETSGASYADLRSQFYGQLQSIYGAPGSNSALETIFNNFTTALQSLSTSPDSVSARSAVLSSGQVLAQQLNGMSQSIQDLRSNAELGLSDAVAKANEAMTRIASINQQLGAAANANDGTTANLLDQRDAAIDQLSQLMDIKVTEGDYNQVTVFTSSGIQLVGVGTAHLDFDAQGSVSPLSQWSADPSKRSLGTITLSTAGGGGDFDLVANNVIQSGKIAALLEMRDKVLVEAQNQLDTLAAGMASALSDKTVDGSPITGPPAGFGIDTSSLLAGNAIHFTYTDNTTGTQHKVTLVRVDDPGALPLSNAATADPNDQVIGINLSAGLPSVVSQLSLALGSTGLQFSSSGSTLNIVDDGAANKCDVNAVSATATVTSLTGGSAELPFFVDALTPYTGAITSVGTQSLGFAARIAVNAGLIADPSRLVVYQTSPLTDAGDGTRPNFLYGQLSGATMSFSPQSGIGTTAAPFSGTITQFLRQIVSQQGQAADAAANLSQGQQTVLKSLQQRFNDNAGVNIDQEMANLLSLQNSYAANARVLSAVKDMVDTLMKM